MDTDSLERQLYASFDNEEYQETIAVADKYISIDPSSADIWFMRARASQRLGDLLQAILDYNKAIELAPDLPHYHFSRGYAFYQNEQIEFAETDYSKVIELGGELEQHALVNRAMLYEESGELQLAMKDWNQLIERYPTDKIYNDRALLFQKMRDHISAANDLMKAYEINPLDDYLMLAGVSYAMNKNEKESLETFEKVKDKMNPFLYCYRGDALLQLGKTKEACESFKRARELGYQGQVPHIEGCE